MASIPHPTVSSPFRILGPEPPRLGQLMGADELIISVNLHALPVLFIIIPERTDGHGPTLDLGSHPRVVEEAFSNGSALWHTVYEPDISCDPPCGTLAFYGAPLGQVMWPFSRRPTCANKRARHRKAPKGGLWQPVRLIKRPALRANQLSSAHPGSVLSVPEMKAALANHRGPHGMCRVPDWPPTICGITCSSQPQTTSV